MSNFISELASKSSSQGLNNLVSVLAINTRLIQTSHRDSSEERAKDLVIEELTKGLGGDVAPKKSSATDRGLAFLSSSAMPVKAMVNAMVTRDSLKCGEFYWALDAISREIAKQVWLLETMPSSDEEALQIADSSPRKSNPVMPVELENLYFTRTNIDEMRYKFERISADILYPLRSCLETFLYHKQTPYKLARFWAPDNTMTSVFCDSWEDIEAFLGNGHHPEDAELAVSDSDYEDYL